MGNRISTQNQPITVDRFKNAIFGLVLLRYVQDFDPKLNFEDLEKCLDSYCLPNLDLGNNDGNNLEAYFNYYGSPGPLNTQSAMDAAIERYVENHLVNDKNAYSSFFSLLLENFYPSSSFPSVPLVTPVSSGLSVPSVHPDSSSNHYSLESLPTQTQVSMMSNDEQDRRSLVQTEDHDGAGTESPDFQGQCELSETGSVTLFFPKEKKPVKRKIGKLLESYDHTSNISQASNLSLQTMRSSRSTTNSNLKRSLYSHLARRHPKRRISTNKQMPQEFSKVEQEKEEKEEKEEDNAGKVEGEEERVRDQEVEVEEERARDRELAEAEESESEFKKHEHHSADGEQEFGENEAMVIEDTEEINTNAKGNLSEDEAEMVEEPVEEKRQVEEKRPVETQVQPEVMMLNEKEDKFGVERRARRSRIRDYRRQERELDQRKKLFDTHLGNESGNQRQRTSSSSVSYQKRKFIQSPRDYGEDLLSMDSEFPPSEVQTPYNVYDYNEEELLSEVV